MDDDPEPEPKLPLSEDELRAAACWSTVDCVSGDLVMTAFKRRARWRQAQWRGDLAMGSHPNTRRNIDAGLPALIDNGVNRATQTVTFHAFPMFVMTSPVAAHTRRTVPASRSTSSGPPV